MTDRNLLSGVVVAAVIGFAFAGGYTYSQHTGDEVQGVAVANQEDIEWTKNQAREDRVCNVAEGMYSDNDYSHTDVYYILMVVQDEYDFPSMNYEVGETAALVIMNSCSEYGVPLRDSIERIQNEGK